MERRERETERRGKGMVMEKEEAAKETGLRVMEGAENRGKGNLMEKGEEMGKGVAMEQTEGE